MNRQNGRDGTSNSSDLVSRVDFVAGLMKARQGQSEADYRLGSLFGTAEYLNSPFETVTDINFILCGST